MRFYIFHGTEGYPEENWFPWLKHELESVGHEVIVPQFPSPPIVAAKVSEWFEVLKEIDAQFDDKTVIVGHSLGGDFALRVLETLPRPVRAAAFIGTPVGVRPILNYDRDVAFSGFDFDWDMIRHNAADYIVFQSDDDPYVSLGNGEELAKNLDVELSFIPKAGHFNTAAGYTEFVDLRDKLLAL